MSVILSLYWKNTDTKNVTIGGSADQQVSQHKMDECQYYIEAGALDQAHNLDSSLTGINPIVGCTVKLHFITVGGRER